MIQSRQLDSGDSSEMWKRLGFWLRDLTLSVVIALVIILFLYQPVKVEGTSMMPALVDQERIFINKFVYRLGIGQVERGDTVVFWYPADPTKSYIKRVIGVPGDHIRVIAGEGVFINGTRLDEPYLPNGESASTITFPTAPADPGPAPHLQLGEAGGAEDAVQAYLNAFFGGETLSGTYQAGWLQQWYTFEMLHNRVFGD